ncbi:MAG: cytochrome C, partial [Desulfuromonas sp.]
MKSLKSISLSLLIVLLSATFVFAIGAGVGRDGTIAATKGKAKTLAELIEMYDSTACIDCHEEIHNDWAE